MVPGQMGRKRMKGKSGLGYDVADVVEVDPVSATCVLCVWLLIPRT